MMTSSAYYTRIGLVVGIFVVLNLLAVQYFFRLDFTEDGQYTLSRATTDILDDLSDPVTVTAYFSEDLPPDIARTRREFRDLLTEYARRSDGQVAYAFVNPNESDEAEMEAVQSGIAPVMINVRERDQMSQRRAFLGAVVQMGEQQDVIPFVQPGAAMEYALSTSIKRLSVTDRPSVAFLQGHGEPPLGAFQQAGADLSVLYELEPLTLQDSVAIPDRIRTLAVVAPADSFPSSHLAQLDAFLARGGNLFVAIDRVEGDLSTASGRAVTTGLETWLEEKGVRVEEEFVVDVNSGTVQVQQQLGPFPIATSVSFPYLPVVSTFAEHPITEGLEAVLLSFASPLAFTGDTAVAYTPLAVTSTQSGTEPAPVFFDIDREWTLADFPASNLTVAALLEGPLAGPATARLVVVGDGDFAVNGTGQQAQRVQPDNVSLLVNGIDWLSDDTGLIELRTKGVTARPLDPLADGTKAFLKYANFLIPLLLVVLYGILRAQNRRRIRRERTAAA